MGRIIRSGISLALVCGLLVAAIGGGGLVAKASGGTTLRARAGAALAGAPLSFVENAGQFGAGARFKAQVGGGTLWLADDALWFTVVRSDRSARPGDDGEASSVLRRSTPISGVNIRLSFAGAAAHPRIEPLVRQATHFSYFAGGDARTWRPDVAAWSGVRYVGLYPGIDLELGGADGVLVPRLVLQPGASAGALSAVRLRVEGADALSLDGDRLRLSTAAGPIEWPLFQTGTEPGTPEIAGQEVLHPFTAAGAAPGPAATPAAPADGALYFSSYLGGSSDDSAWGMAQDSQGALYIAGVTASADFPTTPGGFQTLNGSSDAFVTKIDPTATQIIYSTFLGGSDAEGGREVVVDGNGNLYVTGFTFSTDFPTTAGAFQNTYGGQSDVFLTKLNASGTSLLYSTYIGGSGMDSGRDIVLDGDTTAVVVGLTQSADFPVTANAIQGTYHSLTDGFVLRMNSAGSGLVYSTYLGGADYDEARVVVRDAQGALYIAGRTHSLDYPVTGGAFQTAEGGDMDAFVTKLDAAGTSMLYSTFLGGAAYDYVRGIALDPAGSVYVTGATSSVDFPVTPGAFQTVYGTNQDAFVTKLNPAGSALVYSTYLGAGGGDAGRGIVLDASGAAYVSGWTTSWSFPTTLGAFQRQPAGEGDGFITKVDPTGASLGYSSLFGGVGDDGAYGGLLLTAPDTVVFSGYSGSTNLPVTPGVFQPTFAGGNDDAFVAKLSTARPVLDHLIYLPYAAQNP